ncbi:MAG: Ig-like domain-containing protein [Myxococcales bacterium]|nr:Ig-like domain-containing protein [Myxococcales bacterium]
MLTAMAWLMGCTPLSLPDPEIEGVSPAFAFNGREREISIEGTRFYPEIRVPATGVARVDKAYEGWLTGPGGRVPFSSISLVDDRELSATVPLGVEPGDYTVTVVGPGGGRDTFEGPFVVTDEPVNRLRMSTEQLAPYRAGEALKLSVSVLDLAGEIVQAPVEVELVAQMKGSGASVDVTGVQSTLVEWAATETGATGVLRDGVGEFTFLTQQTGTMEVTVSGPLLDRVPPVAELYDFSNSLDLEVRFELPKKYDDIFVAGRAFSVFAELVDAFGNPVGNRQTLPLFFKAEQSQNLDFLREVTLEGPTYFDVVLTQASEVAWLQFGTADDASRSAILEVVPAEAATVELEPFTPAPDFDGVVRVKAGQDVTLTARFNDAFGNRTQMFEETTLAPDSLAGSGCSRATTQRDCQVVFTRADPNPVVITASSPNGVSGSYAPGYVVSPGDPYGLRVDVAAPPTSGVPFRVEVTIVDEWDNVVDARATKPVVVVADTDQNDATCFDVGFGTAGEVLFDCTMTLARPDAQLFAEILGSVGGQSDTFEVQNGPLEDVVVTPTATVVEAGDPTTLTLQGFDQFGNPFVHQTDPVVSLVDDSGTWSEPTAMFVAGTSTVNVTGEFTEAGETSIHVSQQGVPKGSSPLILVEAGPPADLTATLLAPWAWVGVPAEVEVRAVDAFGNHAQWNGTATLSSATTSSSDVVVAINDGRGIGVYTWDETSFSEVLDATGNSWSSSSDELVVAEDCGVDNPTAQLQFGGHDDAIACLDDVSGVATVTADLGASTANTAVPLYGYAVSVNGRMALADTSAQIDVDLPGAGGFDVIGLAFDDVGCSAEVAALGWAGPDDGTPVGPIDVVPSDTSLPVQTTAPNTVQLLNVVDCSRDPASSEEVRVRSTVGSLAGPVATGSGLAVTLDTGGDGQVDLTTGGGISNGSVDVVAWVPSGAAGGTASLDLTGDNVLPVVVSQDPVGSTAMAVSQIRILFSEPMDPGQIGPSDFTLSGPGASVVQSVTLDGNRTLAVLDLDAPADASLGAWTLTIADDVRDPAGNRLSGDWSGARADYVGTFGAAAAVDAASCPSVTPARFRPDGDDGAGEEADAVEVVVESLTAPDLWVVDVLDSSGTRVRHERLVPVGSADTITWDGRAANGIIVPNGTYTIRIRPDDGFGNRATGCDEVVVVDNAAAP